MNGGRFENDWSTEKLEDIYSDISQAVTVPVDIKVETEHRVLDLGRMEEILRGAETTSSKIADARSKGGTATPPETSASASTRPQVTRWIPADTIPRRST